jgi:hypothetical protein
MSEISLNNFPVELIYRIFDNLDGKTTLFYVHYVCKRLYTIDCHSITMVDFNILCKMLIREDIRK